MKLRLMVGLLALGLSTPALAEVPNPPPMNNQPVIDAANIIPDDREAALKQRLFDLKAKTGHEVAVVTVPDMGGYQIEEYSLNAARFYGIGTKDGDDGVLFLIAPNQRTDRIEVGDGLQSMLTDAQASRINDGMVVPMFKNGDFPGGIELGVEKIAEAITPLTPEQIEVQKRAEAAAAARHAETMASIKDFFMGLLGLIAAALGGFGLFRLVTLPKRRRLERERLAREKAERVKREEERAARRAQLEQEQAEQRERDRLQAIEDEKRERERREREAARKAERERLRLAEIEAARIARQNMLDAMTPLDRAAFLQKEADDAEADRQRVAEAARLAKIERDRLAAIAAAEAAAQAVRDEERRAEERRRDEARRARQRQEEEEAATRRRNDDYYSSTSSWTSSPSPSPSPSPSFDFGGGGGSFSGGGDTGTW